MDNNSRIVFVDYIRVTAHYIRVHMTWDRSKRMTVGAISLLAGALFTGWSFWHAGVPGQIIETRMLEWSWEFCTPNVVLATFGAFVFTLALVGKKHKARSIYPAARFSFRKASCPVPIS